MSHKHPNPSIQAPRSSLIGAVCLHTPIPTVDHRADSCIMTFSMKSLYQTAYLLPI